MKRIKAVFCVLALAVASQFIASPASADQASPEGPTKTMAEKLSATAMVVKVDTQKRHLTLRGDDGNEFTVEVPESVKLDQIQKGDRIKIDYYEAVGISLKKRAAGAQPRAGEMAIVERNAGTLPSGMIAHEITTTVEVVKVDRAHDKVIVKRPDGATDTIHVTDPAMQADLANLHQGDQIQATYTEAAAITVMREGKTKPTGH